MPSYLDKEGSQNLMWGLLAPCRTPYAETFMCAQSTWQVQTARQISALSVCIMQLCALCIFHRLSIICVQK